MSGENDKRLQSVLGFDPTKANDGVGSAFKEALAEIHEERKAVNKVRVKELLQKAIELKTKMAKARKEFESNSAKFDKELGNVLKTIERMSKGEDTQEEQVTEEPKS